jgi:nitrogen fixation/metabolism regulation signal transduction histidine kinase
MSTTSPAAHPDQTTGAYKRSVRNYLLDSRFQLKYSGFLVAVALLISGVLGTVVWSTTKAMVVESQKLIEESKKVSEVSRMNIKDLASDSPELLAEFNKEADEHDQAIADQQARMIHRQEVLIESVFGGLALMVVLIGLLGIYFTHKVAGPVYKIKRLLGQVGQGNLRVEARLRKGDELRDFFEAFTKMVANLRTLEKQQLDYVDKAIDAVDRGAKDDAKVSLGKVRDAMRAALEG